MNEYLTKNCDPWIVDIITSNNDLADCFKNTILLAFQGKKITSAMKKEIQSSICFYVNFKNDDIQIGELLINSVKIPIQYIYSLLDLLYKLKVTQIPIHRNCKKKFDLALLLTNSYNDLSYYITSAKFFKYEFKVKALCSADTKTVDMIFQNAANRAVTAEDDAIEPICEELAMQLFNKIYEAVSPIRVIFLRAPNLTPLFFVWHSTKKTKLIEDPTVHQRLKNGVLQFVDVEVPDFDNFIHPSDDQFDYQIDPSEYLN